MNIIMTLSHKFCLACAIYPGKLHTSRPAKEKPKGRISSPLDHDHDHDATSLNLASNTSE
jgi:hypothetical protein